MTLHDLATAALTRAEIEGFTIESFLTDQTAPPTIQGTPVEVLPNLMQCVEKSLQLALKGRVAWILNPDPFSKIEMKPAFDAGELP